MCTLRRERLVWPCAGTWLALRSLKPLVSSVLGEFRLLGRLQKIPTEEGSGPLGSFWMLLGRERGWIGINSLNKVVGRFRKVLDEIAHRQWILFPTRCWGYHPSFFMFLYSKYVYCSPNLLSVWQPNLQVTWISDSRPWKTDSTIGVALDCDAGTARLVTRPR